MVSYQRTEVEQLALESMGGPSAEILLYGQYFEIISCSLCQKCSGFLDNIISFLTAHRLKVNCSRTDGSVITESMT